MKKLVIEILKSVGIVALSILVSVLVSKLIFEAVYYSDLPAWVKYILLK